MATTPSPLRARISTLSRIAGAIDSFREELRAFPAEYRGDIIAELEALIQELRLPSEGLFGPSADFFSAVSMDEENEDHERSLIPPIENRRVRDRMKDFFRANSNTPSTVAEIMEGIGATRLAVQTILYKRNDEGEFVKAGTKQTRSAPANLWVLSNDEM
jgi:hypothetical protein